VLVVLLGCARNSPEQTGNFVLIKNGNPTAVFVVLPAQEKASSNTPGFSASASIKDFNEDLKECAGCELPVVDADDGQTPAIRFALETRPLPDADRFAITFPDARTMLITGTPLSVRWALNHVLEKFAGVRYLGPARNMAHFPQIADLAVPKSAISMAPSFNLSRRIGSHTDSGMGWWGKRMSNDLYLRSGHEMYKAVFPFKKYAQENKWPDFIFPTIDGKKYLPYTETHRPGWQYSGWQPCLTDERVVDEAAKNICDYFDKNPEMQAVTLGVNDMGGFCQCDRCRPLLGDKRNRLGHPDYSELYYQWLNKVVARVTEKHPDKYFGCMAYREVITPPSFKLHKNIVPTICFDSQACMDQEVRKAWLDLIKCWSEKAAWLGQYDYGLHYALPRVYFGLQQEMMQAGHTNNARAMFVETSSCFGDGPKKYLYHKLAWDVDLDLDMVLTDWYAACVGKEAAPFLAEYFRTWARIWREEAVKTAWFQDSKKATYLRWGENGTYFYAVGREDLPKLRELMEKTVKLAGAHGDKRQQLRAKWLMREFEYSEACVYALGAHILPPSGMAETASQAIEYLKFLPEAVKYDSRRVELYNERKADPETSPGGYWGVPESSGIPSALAQVAGMAADPQVLEAFKAAAKNPDIPREISGLLDVFVKLGTGKPVENLLKDGSFEHGNADGWRNRAGLLKNLPDGGIAATIMPTQERAFSGTNSVRLDLVSPHRQISARNCCDSKQRVESGWYFASAMVYVQQEHPDVEQYVQMRASWHNQERNLGGNQPSPRVSVKPGEWTRISIVVNITPEIKNPSFGIDYICFHHFVKGDVAYIDDIIITPLGK